jgi:glutamine synthetase
VKPNGEICNLFAVPTTEDTKLFKLFVLTTLMALKRNNALYFGAIAPPGNEVRLGGHEAPPRIISAYLGQAVSAIVDGKHP